MEWSGGHSRAKNMRGGGLTLTWFGTVTYYKKVLNVNIKVISGHVCACRVDYSMAKLPVRPLGSQCSHPHLNWLHLEQALGFHECVLPVRGSL